MYVYIFSVICCQSCFSGTGLLVLWAILVSEWVSVFVYECLDHSIVHNLCLFLGNGREFTIWKVMFIVYYSCIVVLHYFMKL